ncbi:MAG: protein-export chaperone SecB [Clostridia bacterium]|nr:protein-export chaperone SecB [Clostridia bacterium]
MNMNSVLILKHLVFDTINFRRLGFQSANNFEPELEIKCGLGKPSEDFGRVTLLLKGEKKDEYQIEISLTGFFSFGDVRTATVKEKLLKQNGVAILLSYLRSQLTALTSQPETTPEVMPVFNVVKMMEENEK